MGNTSLPFEDYPDFRNATVAQIYNFRQSFDGFHWPDLDVDIELDALKHLDRFPHSSNAKPALLFTRTQRLGEFLLWASVS